MKENKEFNEIETSLIADNKLPNSPETGSVKIFTWESAWIKRADPENPEDVERLKRIDNQPEVAKYMTSPDLAPSDFLEENFYAICPSKPKDKIEGFVWLYESDKNTLDDLEKHNLISNSADGKFLEISYARLIDPSLPAEEQISGLIPSAIRQITFSVLEKSAKTVIMAFTDAKNLLSEGVLKNSGFKMKGSISFYGKLGEFIEEDNFWVLDKNELEKVLTKKKNQSLKKK